MYITINISIKRYSHMQAIFAYDFIIIHNANYISWFIWIIN